MKKVSFFVDKVVCGDAKRVLGPSTVTLEDGRIVSIAAGRISGALDFSGCTLLPGFIDTHVHLSIFCDEYQADLFRLSKEERALKTLLNAQRMLRAGFTTLRSAGDADATGAASLEIGRLVEKKLLVAPRICGAAHYISITGGGGDVNAFPGRCCTPDGIVADGPNEMRSAVRREIKSGGDWIKILATGAFLASSKHDSPDNTHFSKEELDAVMDESKRRGIPVMAHAHGARGIELCAKAGVRSIEHASFIDERGVVACLENDVVVVPTLLVFETGDDEAKRRRTACLRKAKESGVRFALGSDFVGWPVEETAREFLLMHRLLGFTPIEAIASGTSWAAQLLQIESRVGTVEIGKCADLVVIKGDPLADLSLLETAVEAVFKDGALVFKRSSL